MLFNTLFATAAVLLPLTSAQLADINTYPVGPLTSYQTKSAKKVCDVTKYGAKADGTTDLGAPLNAAFSACKSGGLVNIPPGTYAMSTFATLSGGNGVALNLDGIIERKGSVSGGTMITITNTKDFELYSSTGTGAMQGFGYQFLSQGKGAYGPRLLRLQGVTSYSVHDIALVDSPAFHLVLANCNQGETYNLIIRGSNEGGLDGIDVSGFQNWIHDVEVTNKDECVTIKSVAKNFLIENIYCNWSGGCAAGSLNANTDVSYVHYSNVYTVNSNQMFMFKSNGGSGSATNFLLENFIGHNNAYSLYINGNWASESVQPGNGISYQDLTFSNWKGDCANGVQRAPIYVDCPNKLPCTGITLENIDIWTDAGTTENYKCANAYGSGYCLRSGASHTTYSSTIAVNTPPPGYSAPRMPNDINSGLGVTKSIAIPTVPNTFFPGATPIKPRAYKG